MAALFSVEDLQQRCYSCFFFLYYCCCPQGILCNAARQRQDKWKFPFRKLAPASFAAVGLLEVATESHPVICEYEAVPEATASRDAAKIILIYFSSTTPVGQLHTTSSTKLHFSTQRFQPSVSSLLLEVMLCWNLQRFRRRRKQSGVEGLDYSRLIWHM